jgi:cellulose biosynthesis protein BcsQ
MNTMAIASPSTQIQKDLAKRNASDGKAICFFNNKGGVGKTTLVANLAAQLAINLNQRVLVVDADPQCNLSQYVLSDSDFGDIYGDMSASGTIYDVIHPLSIGKGYSHKLPVRKTDNFGFDVILGDPRLALKEDLLAQDWRDAKAGGTRGLRTTFLFSNLIDRASEHYDFIFFDMGPSLGAINRSILLSADYFVVPMSVDIFSLWAIRNIGSALSVWQNELANGIRLAEDPSELPKNRVLGRPIGFLGYVTQQHKEKSENKVSRVVEAYNAIKKQLPKAVASGLKQWFPSPTFDPHLGDIRHLASLAPKSQTLHTPMITVTLKGSYTITRKQARQIYEGIAKRFVENLMGFANVKSKHVA